MTGDYTLSQKTAAEFIGTFSIVFFGAGAVTVDLLTAPDSAGTEFVIDGLGFGALGWLGIAIAFMGSIAIPIYLLGHVSGQHINPAVTIALWLIGRVNGRTAIGYVVGQLTGAVAGGLAFTVIRGTEAVRIGAMGATAPFPGVSPWQAVTAEFLITFFLMLTVMAFVVDDRTPDDLAGLAIGFIVATGILATGNISGASFNPARTLGPYVTNTILGGPNLWIHAWIYLTGPIAGAIAGAAVYKRVVLTPNTVRGTDDRDVRANETADD